MAKVIIAILVFSLLGASFKRSSPVNQNHWECHLNNKLLIKGHVGKPDSIVVLDEGTLKQKGVINFQLFFDAPSGKDIKTLTFLASQNGDKVLMSEDTAPHLLGHFTVSRLKQISDSMNAGTLELQCLFDGIDKPWRMFKFKIQD